MAFEEKEVTERGREEAAFHSCHLIIASRFAMKLARAFLKDLTCMRVKDSIMIVM